MKFLHMADVHIGAWRDPKLSTLPDEAFEKAISFAITENVDFIVIAGDLFNTAIPGIEHLKKSVHSLQMAADANIPVYCIPGSHDFSPSGKTMLQVLEEARLLTNLYKGEVIEGKLRLEITVDEKTGAALCGILGKRGMLDRIEYEDLDREWLESQIATYEKSVFLFHTSISELKPKEMAIESNSASLLPKGFSYYAGGHIHVRNGVRLSGYGDLIYPGPLFPASFSELEKLERGNCVLYDNGEIRQVPIIIKEVCVISVDATDKSNEEVMEDMFGLITDVMDKIVLIKAYGKIKDSPHINFRDIIDECNERGAYAVLRSTTGLIQEEMEEIILASNSAKEIEERIIGEGIGKISNQFSDEATVLKNLFKILSNSKLEGETKTRYEERITEDALAILRQESK